MIKRILSLLLTAMLLACLSSSAFAAERNNPIDPWTYQSLLGRGMDVDWCKTRQGMETYDRQIVENFRDMGLSHVRIRVKDDADEQLFSVLDRVIDDCLDCGVIPVLAYQADDMKNQPTQKNIDRVADWWQTVAERYRDKSYRLSFDLVIEVTNALNDKPELLNSADLLDVFETVKALSKPLANPHKFVADWFRAQFPDYAAVPTFKDNKLFVLPKKPEEPNPKVYKFKKTKEAS